MLITLFRIISLGSWKSERHKLGAFVCRFSRSTRKSKKFHRMQLTAKSTDFLRRAFVVATLQRDVSVARTVVVCINRCDADAAGTEHRASVRCRCLCLTQWRGPTGEINDAIKREWTPLWRRLGHDNVIPCHERPSTCCHWPPTWWNGGPLDACGTSEPSARRR